MVKQVQQCGDLPATWLVCDEWFGRNQALLAPVVPVVAAHYERLDGRGCCRRLSGAKIPVGARIIAVADRFDELSHDTPDRTALDPEKTPQQMSEEVGHALCPDALAALAQDLRPDGSVPLSGRRSPTRVASRPD